MKRTIIALALTLGVTGLSAADKKVQMEDLPAAVQKTVQAEEAKGAKIVGLATEVEGGKTMYEVETTVGGHTRDLLLDAVTYEAVVEKNGKKTEVVVNTAGKSLEP